MRDHYVNAGVSVNDDEFLSGYERFYIDDSFGHRVEILQPVDPPARGILQHHLLLTLNLDKIELKSARQ